MRFSVLADDGSILTTDTGEEWAVLVRGADSNTALKFAKDAAGRYMPSRMAYDPDPAWSRVRFTCWMLKWDMKDNSSRSRIPGAVY